MKVGSTLLVKTEELSRKEWRRLFQSLTIIDADDIEISAYEYLSGRGEVRLPRGALALLPARLEVSEFRSMPTMPKLVYARTLDAPGYKGQKAALAAMFKHEQGQIIAPPGNGKTEIAAAFIAACKTRTLVVVHTQDLFNQWIQRMEASVPGAKVGTIQGKQCTIGHVTIAMAQTLKRYLNDGGKFWRKFGCLIVDEAHHGAAETWEWITNVCPAHYRFGFTASEKRSDGRQRLVEFFIGPVIHRLEFESAVPMTIIPVVTNFRTRYNARQWTRVVKQLVNDPERNQLVADIVGREISKGNTVLVLSRQIKHLELMHGSLDSATRKHAKVVHGELPRPLRKQLIANLTDGSLQCIFGTQLFEEGVDIPRINRIVLAFPGTEITVLQKIGRGTRMHVGKTKTLVYDLADINVPVLSRQFVQRRNWYKQKSIRLGKVMRNGRLDPQEKWNVRDWLKKASVARPRHDG